MKAIMMTVRLWWFYLTYKGIKTIEIRKRFTKDFKGKIFEYVSKTNWKKDMMKIPVEEREFFKQFVGKVGLCFECDKVEEITFYPKKPFDRYGTPYRATYDLLTESCLEYDELDNYLNKNNGSAIHITKLEIFDKPKEIKEFYKVGYGKIKQQGSLRDIVVANYFDAIKHQLTRAPQSWCYVEV